MPFARGRIPDETTILKFRYQLEKQDIVADAFEAVNLLLAEQGMTVRKGTTVDATIIEAPSPTRNATGTRDPEMHLTRKRSSCEPGPAFAPVWGIRSTHFAR